MPSRREIAFRAVAVLLGVAVPLAIAEGVAAWLISRDNDRYKPELPAAVRASVNLGDRHIPTRPDPYLSYRVLPNLEGERVRTNEFGLRAGRSTCALRPTSPDPLPGCVGRLGLHVEVERGHDPAYLEAELARRAAEVPALHGRRIEVLNAGVPGTSAGRRRSRTHSNLRELAPNWIVSLDGTNDVAAAIINGRAGVPMR
jgi:hypothetical protein